MKRSLFLLALILISFSVGLAKPDEPLKATVTKKVFVTQKGIARALRVFCDVTNQGASKIRKVTAVCRFLRPDGSEYSRDTVLLEELGKAETREVMFYCQNDAQKQGQSFKTGDFGKDGKAPPADLVFRKLEVRVTVQVP